MKQDYVLRPLNGASEGIGFSAHARNQISVREEAAVSVSILRRDPSGFATILFGDKVVTGFVSASGGELILTLDGHTESFSLRPAALDAMHQGLLQSKQHTGPIEVKSPIPGTIKSVLVEVNAVVEAGQTLAILEAMKMENEIRAPHAGTVEKMCISAGQNVASGALLFTIKC